jgi:alkylhydroperoxidase family enzyme
MIIKVQLTLLDSILMELVLLQVAQINQSRFGIFVARDYYSIMMLTLIQLIQLLFILMEDFCFQLQMILH